MTIAIGVVLTDHITAGRLEDRAADRQALAVSQRPRGGGCADHDSGRRTGGDDCRACAWHWPAHGSAADAIGVAVPGIVRAGIVEDSPNLPQIKGSHLAESLAKALAGRGISAPVHVANDADAIAAGVAATHGQLNKLTRVWTLGNGIGYGRWPYIDGVWEGGHITVSLDPKERYCGCGGVGHLEGIMGYRAMRLRFLDMEPEEIFANAKKGR